MIRPHTNPPRGRAVEWIVCERTSRWAAALRMALADDEIPRRIRELRHLAELNAELEARSTALAAIEIHRGNFADLLAWLPAARDCHPGVRRIALVDRSLTADREAVSDALIEAGAEAIAVSPRCLSGVIALGLRQAEVAVKDDRNAPFAAQVWASLPWQAG